LLSWLNLHDRPAVQVEALLALTNIAELCAQQSYFQHTQAQASAVTTTTQTAASSAKTTPPAPAASSAHLLAYGSGKGGTTVPTPTTYPYPSLVAPAPGSVPFPPLSFSQTLSPEAVAAFDASLVSTIQSGTAESMKDKSAPSASFSMPPAPLFPTSSLPGSFQTTALTSSGINFTSLAPPPSGAHSSVPSNAFLPPPTPISSKSGALSFPQQLSASSQHLLLRHADAIPTLISLLSSPNREVYEQAMWILGSIAAGDAPGTSSSGSNSPSTTIDGGREKSVAARDVILAAGVMNQLLRCLESHPGNLSLQRIGSWTLSNLVDGIFQQSGHSKSGSKSSDYSSSDEIEMSSLLPVLKRLLRCSDAEVLSYTCWTLSHLCDGPSSHIAAVVTSEDPKDPKCGLVPRLVELLIHPSWRVTKPALRTIGNIVCAECSDDTNHGAAATTDYTEVILECGAVPRLMELITHSNREIQKESCWTLSNIAAGTVDQIQAVIDSGAIPPLVKLVRDKKTDQEVRSEACWVVLNATSCGSDSQIEILVDEGCVAVLGVLLSEASMVMMALEGLERVLQVEETREMLRREHMECREIGEDGKRPPNLVSASLIEQARENHNSSAVTKRADRIWKQHFVSCALCKKSFSKHRTSDASFCEECKCYVCSGCNCQIYHLSYQEELWAESEEKTEKKKEAKKSKNKKKKEKLKQKKAKQYQPTTTPEEEDEEEDDPDEEEPIETFQASMISPTSVSSREIAVPAVPSLAAPSDQKLKNPGNEFSEGMPECSEQDQHASVDLVLYLQQTGSIIALAKLIDALDYGEEDELGIESSTISPLTA
jgi:importin subunit alpha-6/7